MFRLAVLIAAGWALVAPALAYVFITDSSGVYVVTWPSGTIPIQVKLSQAPNLANRTISQTSVVLAMMQDWNKVLGTVQLAGTAAEGTYALDNGINEIAMDISVDGELFDPWTLAVTVSERNGNARTESDIIFNRDILWDAYRGGRTLAIDIRRVALHELGHVLGLDHPDEHGQLVSSIMNSYVGSTDELQDDDIKGAQQLYGAPGFKPANDSFANATVVTLTSSSTQMTGTNVAATREPGERDHDGVAQGHSVWWKWTAPSTGNVSFTTYSSNFDTVMAVYTGTAINDLTLVGENDDEEPSSQFSSPARKRTSSVTFGATVGSVYYIAVDGWGNIAKNTVPYTGLITLTASFDGPVISSQPVSLTVDERATATFAVTVGSSGANHNLTYQWQSLPHGFPAWVSLTDGGDFSGVTTNRLQISNVLVTASGDQFRCVITDTAGNTSITVSDAATLTVKAVPLPVVSAPYFSSLYDPVTVNVKVTGAGNFSYQWYHDGVAIAGAVMPYFNVPGGAGDGWGEYYVAVTNGAGTVVSPTCSLYLSGADAGRNYDWVKAVEADGVVYFLYGSPARILRYDLAAETWLPDWTPPQTTTDFVIANDAIYIVAGNYIMRYGRDFGSSTVLVSGGVDIAALVQADDYLVAVTRYNTATSYDRFTGRKISSVSQNALGSGLIYGAANHRIYASPGVAVGSVGSVALASDGTLGASLFAPGTDFFRVALRTMVLPNGTVVDQGGIVYNGADLTYAGNFGGALTDLVPDGNGGYYVLRQGRISAVDNKYREIGYSTGHLSAPRFWRRDNMLYLFARLSSTQGNRPEIEKVAVDTLRPAAPVAAADAAAGHFESSQWLVDEQGVVYIYSKLDRNIYRWSAQTKGFLPSIPLANSPGLLAYSAETRSLYFEENSYQIRRIPLDTDNFSPLPAATAPLALTGLQTAGDFLWLGLQYPWDGRRVHLVLDGTGNPGKPLWGPVEFDEYAWSTAARRMYSAVSGPDKVLVFNQLDAAGAVVASQASDPKLGTPIPPIRVSADGARVAVASGPIYDGTTLAVLGTLANDWSDAAWTGDGLHTVRRVGDSTVLQNWVGSGAFQLKSDRSFPGTPLRLLALPDGKLLLGTLVAGKLNLRVIEPETLEVLSGPPVGAKTAQSITFAALADVTYGDAPAVLNASASSGLPVRLELVSGPAVINAGMVIHTGAGVVVVRASQPGDGSFESAVSVARSFTVRKAVLRVTTTNQTRPYGAANPPMALNYSGFIGRDTEAALATKPVATTVATASSGAGTYPITISGGVSSVYDFLYTPGTLTVTKVPLTVKAMDVHRLQGVENPPLTLTYSGFVNGENQSVLNSQPAVSTTAVIDSPYGSYPITVTGGSSDRYEITRINGTLRIIPPSYDKTYTGPMVSGGYWAMQVRIDGTATYIAHLLKRSSVVVTELTVATDGSFSVNGAEIRQAAQAAGVGALALAVPEIPVIHVGATTGDYALSGQIMANGDVTGTLDGLGETFIGEVEATTGPMQAEAGYYRASALNTATGEIHVILGPSGQIMVVTTTPGAVDGAVGWIYRTGQFFGSSDSGATLSVTITASSQSITASVTPVGSSTPITYAGLAYGVRPDARVINLSVRTPAGTGSQTLIVGFVVTGSGSKPLLLRGIGPGLSSQGVPDALGDSAMRLLDVYGGELLVNNDWGGSAPMAQLFRSLGAFALPGDSKDAALSASLAPGAYSCHVYPSGAGSGITLAEFYDADTAAPTANVVNVSARTQVGTGGNILIAGFVITGNSPKALLIRGLGPTLTALNVPGALADPQIYLYAGPKILASNDNWGGTAELKAAFATVGAGPLVSDTSKDAALLVTLQPGTYTAQVSGVGGTTGVGLVEIFLMP